MADTPDVSPKALAPHLNKLTTACQQLQSLHTEHGERFNALLNACKAHEAANKEYVEGLAEAMLYLAHFTFYNAPTLGEKFLVEMQKLPEVPKDQASTCVELLARLTHRMKKPPSDKPPTIPPPRLVLVHDSKGKPPRKPK